MRVLGIHFFYKQDEHGHVGYVDLQFTHVIQPIKLDHLNNYKIIYVSFIKYEVRPSKVCDF